MTVFNKERTSGASQITGDEFSQLNFMAIIHTFEIGSSQSLLPDTEILAKPYIKHFKTVRGEAIYQINPHKFDAYKVDLNNLRNFELVIDLILSDLLITDFYFRRIDLAVDTKVDYECCYKMNLYLASLWGQLIKSSNICRNINGCMKTSIYCYSRDFTLAIYDKKLESKGISPSSTRIEFRFTRLRKGFDPRKMVTTVNNMLDQLPRLISAVNEFKVHSLQDQLIQEVSIGYESRSLNLQTFINKWAYDVYNQDILRSIHDMNNNGKCKSWLYRYRKKGNQLTLYTKKDLVQYIALIKRALMSFVESHDE